MKGISNLLRSVKIAGFYNVGIFAFYSKSSRIHLAQKTETDYNKFHYGDNSFEELNVASQQDHTP